MTVGAAVVEQIIAETGGDPLALVELPKGLTAGGAYAAGFGLAHARGLPATTSRRAFGAAGRTCPLDARRLLLLAGAGPLGDPALLWRAARHSVSAPPRRRYWEEAGLVEFGDSSIGSCSATRWCARRPTSRPPPRSAASVHAALAEATDPALDPDRRAWHHAHAVVAPERMLPPNWNGRRDERRHAAAPPRRRRSSSEPRRSLQTRHGRADRALAAAHAKVRSRGSPRGIRTTCHRRKRDRWETTSTPTSR